MTNEEKALRYDDLLREGDRINRLISKIKSEINRTPQQEAELTKLNQELKLVEGELNQLFTGQ